MAFTSAEMAVGILMKELRRNDKYSGFTVLDCNDSGKRVLLILSENESINERLQELIAKAIGSREGIRL